MGTGVLRIGWSSRVDRTYGVNGGIQSEQCEIARKATNGQCEKSGMSVEQGRMIVCDRDEWRKSGECMNNFFVKCCMV